MGRGAVGAQAKREDGRRAFLAYLKPDLIKNLKVAALDREIPAYEIVEAALREWLSSNHPLK